MNLPKNGGYVALEGIKHGSRFLTTYRDGDDPTKSGKGETWYRVLGYADTYEEAIRIIYPTKADETAALYDYMVKTMMKIQGFAPLD